MYNRIQEVFCMNDKLYYMWKDYKIKGICEDWNNNFYKFKEWALLNGYEYDNPLLFYYVQRKDKNKVFSPDNCFLRTKGKRENDKINREFLLINKQDICQDYINNYISTRDLSKKYNDCQGTINKILRENNISSHDRKIFVKNLDNEVWKNIDGYENIYQVSNLGRIKTMNYRGGLGEKLMDKKYREGYPVVHLSKNGKTKEFKVHRLVAQTFLPNPYNLPFVNHKNEDRSDANVDNLEWCDREYNSRYSTAKKILRINPINNDIVEYSCIHDVEKEKMCPSNIVKCLKGTRKTAYGYIWKYKNNQQEKVTNIIKNNNDEYIKNLSELYKLIHDYNFNDKITYNEKLLKLLQWSYDTLSKIKDYKKQKQH